MISLVCRHRFRGYTLLKPWFHLPGFLLLMVNQKGKFSIYTHALTYTHVYVYMCVCAFMCIYVYIYMLIYVYNILIYIYI